MESVTMHLFIPSKMLLCMVISPAFDPVAAFPGLSLKTVSTTALPVTCCSPTAASVVLGMEAAGGNQSYNNCFHSTPVKSMVLRQGLAM